MLEELLMQFTEAIDIFLVFKTSENLTERTLEWYRAVLIKFSQWIGPRDIADITSVDVATWLASRQKRNLSTLTVEGYYRGLMAFFNWCEESPLVGSPASPIGHGRNRSVKRPKTDEPDMDYASYEEFEKLTTAIDLATWIDYRDWCMIQIMFWCGVRRGELLGMNVRDLDLNKQEVRIRKSKSRKQRTAFLLEDIIPGLIRYLEMRPLWSGPDLWLGINNRTQKSIGGRLQEGGLRSMLVRRCERAGIRYCNANLFRHGFAMEMLNADAGIKAVSELMGHSNVRTTEKNYAKYQNGPLRRLHTRIAKRIAEGDPEDMGEG
jgi:integrase